MGGGFSPTTNPWYPQFKHSFSLFVYKVGSMYNQLISSILVLTCIGNFQKLVGSRTRWERIFLLEFIALVATSTVHRYHASPLLFEFIRLLTIQQNKDTNKGASLKFVFWCLQRLCHINKEKSDFYGPKIDITVLMF